MTQPYWIDAAGASHASTMSLDASGVLTVQSASSAKALVLAVVDDPNGSASLKTGGPPPLVRSVYLPFSSPAAIDDDARNLGCYFGQDILGTGERTAILDMGPATFSAGRFGVTNFYSGSFIPNRAKAGTRTVQSLLRKAIQGRGAGCAPRQGATMRLLYGVSNASIDTTLNNDHDTAVKAGRDLRKTLSAVKADGLPANVSLGAGLDIEVGFGQPNPSVGLADGTSIKDGRSFPIVNYGSVGTCTVDKQTGNGTCTNKKRRRKGQPAPDQPVQIFNWPISDVGTASQGFLDSRHFAIEAFPEIYKPSAVAEWINVRTAWNKTKSPLAQPPPANARYYGFSGVTSEKPTGMCDLPGREGARSAWSDLHRQAAALGRELTQLPCSYDLAASLPSG